MRTVTLQFKVYKYKELSKASQEKARGWLEGTWGGADWFRATEYLQSIRELAKAFGGEVKGYEISWDGFGAPSFMKFEMPEMTTAEILDKLLTLGDYNKKTLKGLGDCKLTGVDCDEAALDGFRWAIMRGGAKTLDEAMQEAFKTWIKAANDDYAWDFSHDGALDTCEANGYEFREDGSFYKEVK